MIMEKFKISKKTEKIEEELKDMKMTFEKQVRSNRSTMSMLKSKAKTPMLQNEALSKTHESTTLYNSGEDLNFFVVN